MKESFKLNSDDNLTILIRRKGIYSWKDLINYVQNLPYGRNSNRANFKLILEEEKGTCSSKHAFLKEVAERNNIPNVSLILGVYKMNENNTPNIGNVLTENNLAFIPEAHCYLKMDTNRLDITTPSSDIKIIENSLLKEIEIEAAQVGEFKVYYHQEFLKKWILENDIKLNFEEIWSIREKCISNLTQSQEI